MEIRDCNIYPYCGKSVEWGGICQHQPECLKFGTNWTHPLSPKGELKKNRKNADAEKWEKWRWKSTHHLSYDYCVLWWLNRSMASFQLQIQSTFSSFLSFLFYLSLSSSFICSVCSCSACTRNSASICTYCKSAKMRPFFYFLLTYIHYYLLSCLT